ncbi:uncharacterized protein LOC144876215 [Branchiostoma floridae x Branchiostoma japonicum]
MQTARAALSLTARVCSRSRFNSWTKTTAGVDVAKQNLMQMTFGTSAPLPREMERNCLKPEFHYRSGRGDDWGSSYRGVISAVGAGTLFTAGLYGALKTGTKPREQEQTDESSDHDFPTNGLVQLPTVAEEIHTGTVTRTHPDSADKTDGEGKTLGASERDDETDKNTTANQPAGDPETPLAAVPAARMPEHETTTAKKPGAAKNTERDKNIPDNAGKAQEHYVMLKPPKDFRKWSDKKSALRSPQHFQADILLRLVLFVGLLLGWVRLLPPRCGTYSHAIKLRGCQDRAADVRNHRQRDGPRSRGQG